MTADRTEFRPEVAHARWLDEKQDAERARRRAYDKAAEQRACEGCGAEPGEPCRWDCLSHERAR